MKITLILQNQLGRSQCSDVQYGNLTTSFLMKTILRTQETRKKIKEKDCTININPEEVWNQKQLLEDKYWMKTMKSLLQARIYITIKG